MRKYIGYMSFIVIAVFISVLASPMTVSAAAKLKVKWFGYIQATAGSGDGLTGYEKDDDGLRFGADRIRIGYKVKFGKVFSKLQVDFNKGEKGKKAGAAEIIKDAEVGYKFHNSAKIKMGIFKTPVGLDFNTSGSKLDITKRGMEKKLVLERSYGLMLSGRKIGGGGFGFGYDVGIFNPTERSSVVSGGTPGDNYAGAARVMFDYGKIVHVETSYGVSQEAGGAGTEDYKVADIGVKAKIKGLTLKTEAIFGQNLKGVEDADQTVVFVHVGYQFHPMFEGVIRHYAGFYDPPVGDKSDLGNTFVGLNIFLNPKKKYNSRIQLNYVRTSGDDGYDSTGTKKWFGEGGYKDDVFLAQYQVKF